MIYKYYTRKKFKVLEDKEYLLVYKFTLFGNLKLYVSFSKEYFWMADDKYKFAILYRD